jgi:N-acetylneuraminate synthase
VDPYVNAYKIGSGDITWHDILGHIARKKKPVLLATGAATMGEVMEAVRVLLKVNKQVVLMQCNTNYTASIENFKHINLNVLRTYARRFPALTLGLSDHTLGHATVLGGVALGARVFEKHFTDDRRREGPDHKFSMMPGDWREMVDRANEVYAALGDGVKRIEDNEKQTAILQKRALRYTGDLQRGVVLKKEHFFPLRPAPEGSYPPAWGQKLLGKKLKKDVKEQDCFRKGDV